MEIWTLNVFLLAVSALGIEGAVKNKKKVPACCDQKEIISCVNININPAMLGTKQQLKLNTFNQTFKFKGVDKDFKNTFLYENKEAEMVLSLHEKSSSVFGNVVMKSGKYLSIEHCGKDGHFLKEFDGSKLGKDIVLEPKHRISMDKKNVDGKEAMVDNTTIVTYSVKIYYTPQFEAITPNIPAFVDTLLERTNKGYINSKIPIRVKLHCLERATINDIRNSSVMLRTFDKMKGDPEALRGTADAAALLIKKFDACGIAWGKAVVYGNTVSVTEKQCAESLTFGHELGHNLGAAHNRENAGREYYPDGYGHFINKGNASQGYRTIMAYWKDGFQSRVNYYSNPSIILPETGTPTGRAGYSNNARILTLNRFKMASLGDESSKNGCDNPETKSPTTTTPRSTTTTTRSTTTTTRSTTTTTRSTTVKLTTAGQKTPTSAVSTTASPFAPKCGIENGKRFFQYFNLGRVPYKSICKLSCDQSSVCVGYLHTRLNLGACYLLIARSMARKGTWSGPAQFGPRPACSLNARECSLDNAVVSRRVTDTSSTESPGLCEEECGSSGKCEFWSWSGGVCRKSYFKHTHSSRFTYGSKHSKHCKRN